jgi:hypothetical protein
LVVTTTPEIQWATALFAYHKDRERETLRL